MRSTERSRFEDPASVTGTEETEELTRGAKEGALGVEQKDRRQKIASLRDEVFAHLGEKGAEAVGAYFRGELTKQQFEQRVREIPNREEATREAMSALEKLNVVSWAVNPETKSKSLVIDPEKLKSLKREDVQKLGPIFSHEAYGNNSKTDALYWIFRDATALSTEQLQNKEYKEKPVLYIPNDADAAYSPEEIKKADFHLGIWEMSGGGAPIYGQPYPIRDGSQKADAGQVRWATVLYHPKFGDAYRDTQDILQVRDAKSREYRKLSTPLIRGYGISTANLIMARGGRRESGGMQTVQTFRQAIRGYLGELVARKLITPEDFRVEAGYKFSDKERVVRATVSPSGCVMFNRTLHYLSRDFYGKPIRIYQLGEDLGGVASIAPDGTETLTHTFRIYKQSPETQKGKGWYVGGRGKLTTELAEFNPEKVALPRRADESEEAYKARVEAAKGFGSLLKISNDLSAIGVSLHKEDLRKQVVISRAAEALDDKGQYERFLRTAKRYGESAVNAFFAAEYDTANGFKILEIAERFPPEEARAVFEHFNAINDDALGIAEAVKSSELMSQVKISDATSKVFGEQLQEAVLRKAKDMLNTAAEIAKHGSAKAVVYEKETIESRSSHEVIEALTIYEEALGKIRCLMKPEDAEDRYQLALVGESQAAVPRVYTFEVLDQETGKTSHLMVQVRDRGVAFGRHNGDLEYDGEARVNILMSEEPIALSTKSPSRSNALSIRIDREGVQRRGSEVVKNDPTARQGELSLDIGSLAHGDKTLPAALVGKIVSIGNALEVAKEQEAGSNARYAQYYHNRESFARELGDADTFARLAHFIETKIKKHYPASRPG